MAMNKNQGQNTKIELSQVNSEDLQPKELDSKPKWNIQVDKNESTQKGKSWLENKNDRENEENSEGIRWVLESEHESENSSDNDSKDESEVSHCGDPVWHVISKSVKRIDTSSESDASEILDPNHDNEVYVLNRHEIMESHTGNYSTRESSFLSQVLPFENKLAGLGQSCHDTEIDSTSYEEKEWINEATGQVVCLDEIPSVKEPSRSECKSSRGMKFK